MGSGNCPMSRDRDHDDDEEEERRRRIKYKIDSNQHSSAPGGRQDKTQQSLDNFHPRPEKVLITQAGCKYQII